jgi:hypothetical protein
MTPTTRDSAIAQAIAQAIAALDERLMFWKGRIQAFNALVKSRKPRTSEYTLGSIDAYQNCVDEVTTALASIRSLAPAPARNVDLLYGKQGEEDAAMDRAGASPAPADQSDAGRNAVIEWTPALEAARLQLCEFWLAVAESIGESGANLPGLRCRAIETEQALTLLGDIAIRALTAAPAETVGGWKCGADRYGPDPQDCNWPYCGCDPHAERVMSDLAEHGWYTPDEVSDLKRQILPAEAIRKALKETDRYIHQMGIPDKWGREVMASLAAALSLLGEK